MNADLNKMKINKNADIKKNGRPSKWKSGETIAVRIPAAFAEEILKYAHYLDEGY